ncbi:glycosyltransferase family 2 protein [Desulfurobacterium thermolithotrophum]
MKISVIIPTYNAEEYLGKLLSSIKLQSVKDIELIIIDSSSTD